MDERTGYRAQVERYYAAVIEPCLRENDRRDGRLYALLFALSLPLIAVVFLTTPDSASAVLAKVAVSIVVWSFLFMCGHVILHVHMWKHRGTLNQNPFAFYHHYADARMYSKYPGCYRASHIQALGFVVIPIMYIDNVMGATMVLLGVLDLFAHEWYHTPRGNRRSQFGPVWYRVLAAAVAQLTPDQCLCQW